MTSAELKKYILEEDKVEYILEQLGCRSVEFHEAKGYWSAIQPYEDADNKMGVVIKNCEYLNYYSYSRGIDINDGKDIFTLVQESKKISFAETMKYIHKLFGLDYTFKKQKNVENKIDPLAIFKRVKSRCSICNVSDFEPLDEDVLEDFVPIIHIDLFREGITQKTIKKFGLAYSYRWKRTIFPIRYWSTGELMGYNSRTSIENYNEFGITKYFITPGLKKEINLYGLWENYKSIQQLKYITLFEAEKSVVKRDSRLDESCVALQGHVLSEEQCRIILGLDIKEIIIAMDKDVPLVEVWHICEKFYRIRKVSYIYDKWDILGDKDSPADANNKIYNFMFKYRVTYDEHLHREYLKSLEKKG